MTVSQGLTLIPPLSHSCCKGPCVVSVTFLFLVPTFAPLIRFRIPHVWPWPWSPSSLFFPYSLFHPDHYLCNLVLDLCLLLLSYDIPPVLLYIVDKHIKIWSLFAKTSKSWFFTHIFFLSSYVKFLSRFFKSYFVKYFKFYFIIIFCSH